MKHFITILLLAFAFNVSAQTTTQDILKFTQFMGTSGLLYDGTEPPDIVPRWYSTEYHHISNTTIEQSAEYTTGVDVDSCAFIWYHGDINDNPWHVGMTWEMGEPEWHCDGYFYMTLVVYYKGQTWRRKSAVLLYWQENVAVYPNCQFVPSLSEVIMDGAAMSFGEYEPYHFYDWPAYLDTNGDWELTIVDLLDLLANFE